MSSIFKNNIGMIDRTIRIIVGLILIGNVYAGLHTPRSSGSG